MARLSRCATGHLRGASPTGNLPHLPPNLPRRPLPETATAAVGAGELRQGSAAAAHPQDKAVRRATVPWR